MNWRVFDLVAEAWRNLRAAPGRTFLLVGVTAVLMGGLAFVETSMTSELIEFNDRYVAAGSNAVVVYSDTGLPASTCSTTRSLSGVLAGGAVSSTMSVETDMAPGTLFNTAAGTTGLWDVIATSQVTRTGADGSGWIIGEAAADELGLSPGMMLGIDGHLQDVDSVVDTELRDPQASRWIMTTMAPTGLAAQCWIEYEPGITTGRIESASAIFAGVDDAIAVPLIRLDEFSRDPVAELANRPARYGWVVAGSVIALTVWVMAWFRRADIGLYRALGTRSSGLTIIGSIEAAVPLTIGATLGTLWGVAVAVAVSRSSIGADQWSIVLRSVGSGVLLALIAAPLPWTLGAREPIADQLKDR